MKMEEKSVKTQEMMSFSLIDLTEKTIKPVYEEVIGSKTQYVRFGPSNTFPNELYAAILESPTASSIVNGTCEYIKGYNYTTNFKAYSANAVNRDGDTLEDVIECLDRDYMIFGGCALQVIFNRLNEPSEIYHIPIEYLRANEDKTKFYFSKKFGKYSGKAVVYDKFDKENVPESHTQIFYYSNNGRRTVYPVTPFTSCLEDIVIEALTAKFSEYNLANGLNAKYVIDLPSAASLTDEQKKKIEKGITTNFCGFSSPFMVYYNTIDKPLNINKIDSDDRPNLYKTLKDAAKQNIFVANFATPQIFGDVSASTGFNSQEFQEAFALYEKMRIIPCLRVIERVFESIFGPEAIVFDKKYPQQ